MDVILKNNEFWLSSIITMVQFNLNGGGGGGGGKVKFF